MSLNALVIDDEKSMLFILSQVLEGEGFEVETVSSGREALNRVEGRRFDLIVTDILMPGELSIRGLIESLEEAGQTAPLIVISAYWDSSMELRAYLEKKAYACLKKPFDINEFRRAVRRAIRKESRT